MTQRPPSSWLQALVGLAAGAMAGALVPLHSEPEGAPSVSEVAPVTLSPSSELAGAPAPAPSPSAVTAPREEELHASQREQRAEFLAHWGRPPLPNASEQPSPQELETFLASVTDYEVRAVDCWTYPCVAVLFGLERDDALRDRIRETFPYAEVNGGPMKTGRGESAVQGMVLSVAFLDRPIEHPSPEWTWTGRLMAAMRHRADQENFEALRRIYEERIAAAEAEAP